MFLSWKSLQFSHIHVNCKDTQRPNFEPHDARSCHEFTGTNLVAVNSLPGNRNLMTL